MSGHIRPVLCLALLLALMACNRKPETSATSGEAPPPASAPSAPAAPADPATAAVSAVSLGPTALPLAIRFTLPAPSVVGQPAKLNLWITAGESLSHVEIDANSTALAIDPVSAKLALDSLEPGQAQQRELGFTASSPGLADVELEVRVRTGNEELHSRYAVPVLSVDPPAAPAGS